MLSSSSRSSSTPDFWIESIINSTRSNHRPLNRPFSCHWILSFTHFSVSKACRCNKFLHLKFSSCFTMNISWNETSPDSWRFQIFGCFRCFQSTRFRRIGFIRWKGVKNWHVELSLIFFLPLFFQVFKCYMKVASQDDVQTRLAQFRFTELFTIAVCSRISNDSLLRWRREDLWAK